MDKNTQLKIVTISYIISVVGSFIINYLKIKNIDFHGVVDAIKVSSILTFWWLFYFKIGWKIPILKKVLFRINLEGTWFGTYESCSIKENITYSGEIALRIKQDFLNVSIISFTDKFKNYSYSEELKYEEKSNMHELVYVYSQKENSISDRNSRNGASELKLILNNTNNTQKLEGDFWTSVGSRGVLKVTKISKKVVSSFEEAKKIYKQSGGKA
ncbi:MAG: hypothetical protein K0S41_208 [Anaerocolumna sp.]|jgi:hypothetical protein|nr:hypothetical protein [Anaerocolumna sp.]